MPIGGHALFSFWMNPRPVACEDILGYGIERGVGMRSIARWDLFFVVETQPKIVITSGTPGIAEDIRAQLGDKYEVVFQPDESGLAGVLRALGEGVCIVEPSGEVHWSNEYYLGLELELRRRVEQICVHAASDADADGRTVGGAVVSKHELVSADNDRHFEIYITSLSEHDEDGTHAGRVAAVVRDVTIARRTLQKMNAIDHAGFELVRLDVEEIRRMNAYERLQLLEQRIVKCSKELLQFDHFAIFLVEQKTNKLQLVMKSGLPEEIQDLDLYLEAEGSGISGMVASTGESYICHDTTADERFLPGLSGARSSLTVPLRVSDRVIGIMDIESQSPYAFNDQDRQFAEIFGRYVAMALHMLQLLVTERSSTNTAVSDRFEGELHEPLEDILHEVDWLDHMQNADPETKEHINRILIDVEEIKSKMRSCASGPQTILGVDQAVMEREKDPQMIGKRVLIADDAKKIRKIIGEVLSHRGCETDVVADGLQAIRKLEAVDAGEIQPYDLIISDIQMPDRNGYEVFAKARKSCPDASVILMTGFGYDPHHSIVRASQEGLQSVLFKPFEIQLLMGQVREAFGITG